MNWRALLVTVVAMTLFFFAFEWNSGRFLAFLVAYLLSGEERERNLEILRRKR